MSNRQRREILQTMSVLSMAGFAGCSFESDSENPESTTNGTSDAGDKKGAESRKVPVDVEDYTLPAEYTHREIRGQLELVDEDLFWAEKISPPEPENYGSGCYALECEVSVSNLSDTEGIDVFLLRNDDIQDYREKAKLEHCYNLPVGVCRAAIGSDDYLDQSFAESQVTGVDSGQTGYIRYLIPEGDYWLVIDGTDVFNKRNARQEYAVEPPDIEMDVRVRLLDNNFEEAQFQAFSNLDNWFSELPKDAPEKKISEGNSLAGDICGIKESADITGESVEDVARNAKGLNKFTSFLKKLLPVLRDRYNFDLSPDIPDMLNKMTSWVSTALPIVGTTISVVENACAIATADRGVSDKKLAEMVESLFISVGSLIVQLVFLKAGTVRRVTASIAKTSEQYLLAFLRQFGGLRLFGYLIINTVIDIEEGIIAAIQHLVKEIAEGFADLLTEQDVELLERISSDDEWDDLEYLTQADCTCEGITWHEVCEINTTF